MTTAQNPITTEVPLKDLTGDQLRARVARASLYLIDMAPIGGPTTNLPASLVEEHLRYLYKLEIEGRLYGCGPTGAGTDEPGHELAIIAATSRSEAEAIAANEPLHKAGVRRNSVRAHTMNEGVACYVGRTLSKRVLAMAGAFDPDISGITLAHDELVGRAAGAHLHLIYLEPTDKPRAPEDAQTGIDHFVWLRDNEMKAKLMSCGPMEPLTPLAPGIWGGGLGVVATSRNEAEAIAAAEPSGRVGYRKLSVVPWTLNYGLAAPIGKALEAINSLP